MTRKNNLSNHKGLRLIAVIVLSTALLLSTSLGSAAAPLGQSGANPDNLPGAEVAAVDAVIAQGSQPEEGTDDPEAAFKPDYLHLATGNLDGLETVPRYPWPYALQSIGHTMASYQNYGSNPYFHHGIDGLVDAGNPVYATSGGQVVNIENYTPGNDLYWEVAILDPNGFIWQFHHIEVSSIPQAIWDKYDEYQADPVNGGFIAAGTLIGEVVYWPVVTFGERFNHIHLNILGAGGAYVDGFAFLEPLADTQTPEIQAVGLLQGGQIISGNQVSGSYGLYAHVRDLVLHDQFYVPPYELTISVDGGPAETVWRFDNLPGGGDRYAYVSNFFIPPTCGNYTCRDFYIDLGFIPDSGRSFPSAGGPHSMVVTARDNAGNETSQTFNWTVLAPPSGTSVFFEDFENTHAPDFVWTTNPAGTDTATTGFWEVGNPEPTDSSGPKQLGTTVSGDNDLVTGRLAGTGVGSYDVDNGWTSVRSPDIVLPNSPDLSLSFYSYLAHTTSNNADYFRVTVVESAPSATRNQRSPNAMVVWEEFGVGSDRDAAWAFHLADIGAFAGQTVYLLIEAADAGTQNIVEAAVDDVQITLTGPLAVTLDHFSAQIGRGHVALDWETVSEMDNLGFNLYRSQSEAGPRSLLGFIPSQAPGSSQGFSYIWRDFTVTPGASYWYWLEDVSTSGVKTMHGPVNVAY